MPDAHLIIMLKQITAKLYTRRTKCVRSWNIYTVAILGVGGDSKPAYCRLLLLLSYNITYHQHTW